jgi:hypothetical protein
VPPLPASQCLLIEALLPGETSCLSLCWAVLDLLVAVRLAWGERAGASPGRADEGANLDQDRLTDVGRPLLPPTFPAFLKRDRPRPHALPENRTAWGLGLPYRIPEMMS